MKREVEKFTDYKNSKMYYIVHSLLDFLNNQKTIDNPTNNDKLALNFLDNFKEVLKISDETLFPLFSNGNDPKLQLAMNLFKLKPIDDFMDKIFSDIYIRRGFYRQVINHIKNCDRSENFDLTKYLYGAEYKNFIQGLEIADKNTINLELLEKISSLKNVIDLVSNNNISMDEGAAILSLPNSDLFYQILVFSEEIFSDNTDLNQIISFYDHNKNAWFIDKALNKSFLKKYKSKSNEIEYVSNIDGKIIYNLDKVEVNITSLYTQQPKYLSKMLKLYTSVYNIDEKTTVEDDFDAKNLEVIFPAVSQYNEQDLSGKLLEFKNKVASLSEKISCETHEKKYSAEITNLYCDLEILESFKELYRTNNKLTYKMVNDFLNSIPSKGINNLIGKFRDKDSLSKFEYLKSLLGCSVTSKLPFMNDDTQVFWNFTVADIYIAIDKKQTQINALKNLDKIQENVNDDDKQSEMESSSDDSKAGDKTVLIAATSLCKEIEKYLLDIKVEIVNYSVNDFFEKDLVIEAEKKVLKEIELFTDNESMISKDFGSDFKDYLKQTASFLKNYRGYLLNDRLLSLDTEVKEYIINNSQNILEINKMHSNLSHSSIHIDNVDSKFEDLQQKIAANKSFENRLVDLNIKLSNLRLPTDIEMSLLVDKIEKDKREAVTKNVKAKFQTLINSYKFDFYRNSYLEKVIAKINEYTNNCETSKDDLNKLITQGLKKYNNLYLRSCLFNLKANILDYDGKESKKITGIEVHDNARKTLPEKIFNSFLKIYVELQNIVDPELSSKLYEYLNQFLNEPNKEEAFQRLKEKFITRLHSYDYQMFKQDKTWSERKLTIIAAILSFGIALGISYAVTKLVTGHAYLLWEKTHQQHSVQNIVELLPSINPTLGS